MNSNPKAPQLNVQNSKSEQSATGRRSSLKGTSQDPPSSETPVDPQSRRPIQFDYTNLGVFFNSKQRHQTHSVDSSALAANNNRKSNETSFNKDPSIKQTSSKEASKLDDLYENTTVLSGITEGKKKSDYSASKNLSEDSSDFSQNVSQENSILKSLPSNKPSSAKASSQRKSSKDERLEENSAKSSNNESEDYEKNSSPVPKDPKIPLGNFDPKIMERIKSKVKNNTVPISFNENPKPKDSTPTNFNDLRTNNHSLFSGPNKIQKAVNPLFNVFKPKEETEVQTQPSTEFPLTLETEKPKDANESDELLFSPFTDLTPNGLARKNFSKLNSHEIFENPAKLSLQPKTSSNSEHTLRTGQIGILSDNDETRSRSKPKLSLYTNDSDGSAYKFPPHDIGPHSTSSHGYDNSRHDLFTPGRVDSARIGSDNSESSKSASKNFYPTGYYSPYGSNQRAKLNHSGFVQGGHFDGESSDRNSSHSGNDEFIGSTMSSAYSTPQGRQQQAFSRSNMMFEQQCFMMPQNMQNFKNQMHLGGMIPGGDQNRRNLNQGRYSNDGKNQLNVKPRKKTQEIEEPINFEIEIDKVEVYGKTTLMVKNIPNKYDLNLLQQTIDRSYKGKYDFLYLPIDFKNKCNVGYAFINFIEPKTIKNFYCDFHGKKWEKFNSEKICEIKYARIQGLEALIDHFQYSSVMNQQDKKLKPYITQKQEFANNERLEELVERQRKGIGNTKQDV